MVNGIVVQLPKRDIKRPSRTSHGYRVEAIASVSGSGNRTSLADTAWSARHGLGRLARSMARKQNANHIHKVKLQQSGDSLLHQNYRLNAQIAEAIIPQLAPERRVDADTTQQNQSQSRAGRMASFVAARESANAGQSPYKEFGRSVANLLRSSFRAKRQIAKQAASAKHVHQRGDQGASDTEPSYADAYSSPTAAHSTTSRRPLTVDTSSEAATAEAFASPWGKVAKKLNLSEEARNLAARIAERKSGFDAASVVVAAAVAAGETRTDEAVNADDLVRRRTTPRD